MNRAPRSQGTADDSNRSKRVLSTANGQQVHLARIMKKAALIEEFQPADVPQFMAPVLHRASPEPSPELPSKNPAELDRRILHLRCECNKPLALEATLHRNIMNTNLGCRYHTNKLGRVTSALFLESNSSCEPSVCPQEILQAH